jgi:ribosomal protein S30
MAKRIIETLFARLTNRKRERSVKRTDDIRQACVLIGDSELGGGGIDLDLDYFAQLLESEGIDESVFRQNVEKYKTRVRWANEAKALPALQAEVSRLSAAADAFDKTETERYKRALTQLERMRMEVSRSEQAAIAATTALAELQATALPPADARELSAQLREVNERINEVQSKLRAGQPDNFPGDLWGSLDSSPKWLAMQTQKILADKKTPVTPERRKKLEGQLSAAEGAVKKCQRELVLLEKRREAINAKQSVRPEDALKPENFAIVRSRKRPEVLRVHPFTGKVLTGATPQ